MSGGMIPDRDWHALGRDFSEAQEAAVSQKILCARCVKAGKIDPPEKIVVYHGETCCGTHFQQIIEEMS